MKQKKAEIRPNPNSKRTVYLTTTLFKNHLRMRRAAVQRKKAFCHLTGWHDESSVKAPWTILSMISQGSYDKQEEWRSLDGNCLIDVYRDFFQELLADHKTISFFEREKGF